METKRDLLPKILAVAVWIFALVTVGVLIGMIVSQRMKAQEDAEYLDYLVDLASEKEELNDRLKEIVKNDPNYEYFSTSFETKYMDVPGRHFYRKDGVDSTANALASGVGVLTGRKVEVEDFVTNETDLESFTKTIGDKYGVELYTSGGMNANILNYHLDHSEVVVISAKGDEPYSETGRAILVFGGRLVDGLYLVYSPEGRAEEYTGSKIETIPKTTLFESMKSDEKFYVLKTQEEK